MNCMAHDYWLKHKRGVFFISFWSPKGPFTVLVWDPTTMYVCHWTVAYSRGAASYSDMCVLVNNCILDETTILEHVFSKLCLVLFLVEMYK